MDNNVSIPEALSISSVQSYIQSLPYKCESVDEMDRHLERIVGKIFVLASAKYWVLLTTWDAALQCWLELRYPIRRDLRAKLVKVCHTTSNPLPIAYPLFFSCTMSFVFFQGSRPVSLEAGQKWSSASFQTNLV